MQPETVLRLSTHKNIVGIKEASGNKDRSISYEIMLAEYEDFHWR